MTEDEDPVFFTSMSRFWFFSDISLDLQVAKEANIPVLLPEWIDDLWERSLVNDINGIKELGNKDECPMFHQLNVTISQLPENEKMKVKKLIEDGGKA